MGEAFVLNFTPLNKSTPSVEKTYEEVMPNRERKITFSTKPGLFMNVSPYLSEGYGV